MLNLIGAPGHLPRMAERRTKFQVEDVGRPVPIRGNRQGAREWRLRIVAGDDLAKRTGHRVHSGIFDLMLHHSRTSVFGLNSDRPAGKWMTKGFWEGDILAALC